MSITIDQSILYWGAVAVGVLVAWALVNYALQNLEDWWTRRNKPRTN